MPSTRRGPSALVDVDLEVVDRVAVEDRVGPGERAAQRAAGGVRRRADEHGWEEGGEQSQHESDARDRRPAGGESAGHGGHSTA